MTKWLHRAVGTIGVAGGFLLLAGGPAQAQQAQSLPVSDPQQLRGMLDDLFTPLGGDDLGLTQLTAAAPLGAPAQDLTGSAALDAAQLPDLAGPLPIAGLPAAGLPIAGLPAADLPLGGLPVADLPFAGLSPAGALGAVPLPLADGGVGPVESAAPLDGVTSLAGGTALDQLVPAPANLLPALIGDAMTAQHPRLFSGPEVEPPPATLPTLTTLPSLGGLPTTGAVDALTADPVGGLPLGGSPLSHLAG